MLQEGRSGEALMRLLILRCGESAGAWLEPLTACIGCVLILFVCKRRTSFWNHVLHWQQERKITASEGRSLHNAY